MNAPVRIGFGYADSDIEGAARMAETVNLDALIPREDFYASDTTDHAGQKGKPEATVSDLRRDEAFSVTLRKPDFQRETSAWSPTQVRDLVKAFVDDELIPAVICWQSPTRLSFVIDGSHRLSAVMAWLFDDYGDGNLSLRLNDGAIPDEQIKVAKKTRDMVEEAVGGAYSSMQEELKKPGSIPRLSQYAIALAHVNVPLLWVRGAESEKAERAFFKINQSAVAIDPTELQILNSRTKPNAVSARAIVRNTKGHKYWQRFSDDGKDKMVRRGQAIYSSLYYPPLPDPIRQEDLPIAGRGYGTQTLPLIFDFVNIATGQPVIDVSKSKKKFEVQKQPPIDEHGTLEAIKSTQDLCDRITGKHDGSLGLHPAVYFYSSTGRHQPTAVLAIAKMMMEREDANDKGALKFIEFTQCRAQFEDYLITHKNHINQLVGKHGSMSKGYGALKDYYEFILRLILSNHSISQIDDAMADSDKYHWLTKDRPVLTKRPKKFSGDAKEYKFLSDALSKAFVCNLCHARIDKKAMQLGHDEDRKDGGLGTTQNSDWQHPFCNSTYKPWLQRQGRI